MHHRHQTGLPTCVTPERDSSPENRGDGAERERERLRPALWVVSGWRRFGLRSEADGRSQPMDS